MCHLGQIWEMFFSFRVLNRQEVFCGIWGCKKKWWNSRVIWPSHPKRVRAAVKDYGNCKLWFRLVQTRLEHRWTKFLERISVVDGVLNTRVWQVVRLLETNDAKLSLNGNWLSASFRLLMIELNNIAQFLPRDNLIHLVKESFASKRFSILCNWK